MEKIYTFILNNFLWAMEGVVCYAEAEIIKQNLRK